MPKYMLLLHDDPGGFMSLSPEDMQKAIEKYIAWGNRLRAEGVILDGNKLKDEPGKVLRRVDGRPRTTDGPHTEAKEVLGGYYVIEAASYDDAAAKVGECPHLDFGSIEIREIDIV
jgi:hypothetical protein